METKLCRKCNTEKSTLDFSVYKGKIHSACKTCVSEITKKWQQKLFESANPEDILNSTFYRIRQSSASNAKSRKIPFELSLQDLRDIYQKQQGKCYYTGTPMTLRFNGHLNRDPLLISIDRLDSTQGYTHTNTVFCCWGINALKGYHPESTLYTTLKLFYENAVTLGKY